MKPGTDHTDRLHSFFGNMTQGGAASNGTAFPNMRSGDGGASGTTEQNGLTPATNCQDTKDTVGYWIPEPFTVTSALAATPLFASGNGCSSSCHPSTNFHQRVYYISHGTQSNQEIPDGTIMVNGYPDVCMTDMNLPTPDGCTNPPTTSYPQDQSVVEYFCGEPGRAYRHTAVDVALRLHPIRRPRRRRQLLRRSRGHRQVPLLLGRQRDGELPGTQHREGRERAAQGDGSGYIAGRRPGTPSTIRATAASTILATSGRSGTW